MKYHISLYIVVPKNESETTQAQTLMHTQRQIFYEIRQLAYILGWCSRFTKERLTNTIHILYLTLSLSKYDHLGIGDDYTHNIRHQIEDRLKRILYAPNDHAI